MLSAVVRDLSGVKAGSLGSGNRLASDEVVVLDVGGGGVTVITSSVFLARGVPPDSRPIGADVAQPIIAVMPAMRTNITLGFMITRSPTESKSRGPQRLNVGHAGST